MTPSLDRQPGAAGDPVAALGSGPGRPAAVRHAGPPRAAGHLPGPAVRHGAAPAVDAGGVHRGGHRCGKDTLSREHQGPRAVLNAVERLARGYRVESERTRQDLAVAEGQLRDYQARVGQPFPHAAYLDQLAALRDQLKAGLSGAEPKEGEPTVAELAEKIKALRAANSVEAAPTRTATRRLSAEEPVTARIRRREQEGTGEWQRLVSESGDRKAGRG